MIKLKTKNTTLSERFQNQIKEIVETDTNRYPYTQIHDNSLSWIGTGISIKKWQY